MKMLVLSVVLVVCLWGQPSASEGEYKDCPGNDNISLKMKLYRRCCKSDELPKNCECFDIRKGTDFTNSNMRKPDCPDDLNIIFNLYTRSNPNSAARIRSGNKRIASTPFDGAKKTVFISHGFTDSGSDPWVLEMKDELLKEEDLNVITVDWKKGARAPQYYKAVANTRTVGAMIARLIQDMNKFNGASFDDFHLVGHSLGAQVSGYAGKEIVRLTGQKVGRITGMDPAGPGFEKFSAKVRIDKSDAQFVDIIHTDAELVVSAGFGMRNSVGHVDFYPNGGQHQPGCPAETYGLISLVDIQNESEFTACSHSRSFQFFSSSIGKCRFDSPTHGAKCTMGYHVDPSCTGDHHPTTTASKPFC